ncbi:MAG: SLBB domain-containing protein, partial [Gemmatimonadetes bacterium]|nr:SLBB domain-containing protein [Gemmatimonadota bacterium]
SLAQVTAGTSADSATAEAAAPAAAPVQLGPAIPLDVPVRRSEYQLGPGDVVNVSLFGDLNLTHTLTVTPEGTVVVPTVGVVRVLDQNLDEAQSRVRQAVLRLYRNVDVSLSLAQVRTFKVFVLGSVARPGVRLATPATRVSEVVGAAAASTDALLARNIILRRATGDSVRVDLARFFLAAEVGANPRLQAGDVVVVRAADETIQVYGRVFNPGTYEYRPGESLADFLSLANAGAGFPANAADTVRVTRFVSAGEREFLMLSRADAVGARGRGLALRAGDAVFVPEIANFRRQQVATVSGQVLRPGVYPIRPDTTTVRELVEMAGGFTPQASLVSATLRRTPTGQLAATPTSVTDAPAETLSREEQQIRRIRAQGDESNVVIDFQRLFAEGQSAYDQTVRSGDILTIPERRDEVAVLGAVRTPGVVRFTPGMPASHYVNLAGWYTRRADWRDAVVLRARLGTPIPASDVGALEPGDVVVVPFRERRTVVERLATTQAVAGIASGLIFTIIGLGQILD